MIKFRSRVEDGIIIPEIPLSDYLSGLYTDPNLALGPIHRTQSDPDVIITEGELETARDKLSRHKAVGIDLLRDMEFHSEEIWD